MNFYKISKILLGMATFGILSFSLYLLNKKVNVSKTKAFFYQSANFDQGLNYRLYIPSESANQKCPLVLTLHGAAQRGNDNHSQLANIALTFISKENQKKFPCFVLSPQCPENKQWLNNKQRGIPFDHYNQSEVPESDEMKLIMELIPHLLKQYNIDNSRIYVVGFSMGSSGTWDIITRHPEVFAAAVPISGVSDLNTAKKIKIPVWVFHGAKDNISPVRLNQEMQQAINVAGGKCKLTVFKYEGHGCCTSALNYPGFMEWLFLQKKS